MTKNLPMVLEQKKEAKVYKGPMEKLYEVSEKTDLEFLNGRRNEENVCALQTNNNEIGLWLVP